LSRPAVEVADIFGHCGPAWRASHAGHVSLGQLKVISAIERRRTAALGGHVERCEACAHLRICYNSCPKCQVAAAQEWLADRRAELLPVPYFHVVFTLPGPIADIAYQNQAVVYHLLLKVAAETLITIATDPRQPTPDISAPASGLPPCSTPGDRRSLIIRTPILSYRAAASRPTASIGSPGDPASSCPFGCSHASSVACS
jgi:radical SAM protein with 4Fe4S-binding SPASM domain